MSVTKTSEILLARLAEGLDTTAQMTQVLLSDLKESEGDFAAMKTELNILKENVKGLSDLVRDGGTSSLLAKIIQVEESIKTIKKWIDNHIDVHQRMKIETVDIKKRILDIETKLIIIEKTIKEIEDSSKEEEKKTNWNLILIKLIIFALILAGLRYVANSYSLWIFILSFLQNF